VTNPIGWPALATGALLTAPFLARSTIAAINWWRVHGRITYTPNVNPRIETTDFPPPNRPGRELLRSWAIALLALPLSFWVEGVLGQAVPVFVWQVLFVLATGPSLVWIFRRLRSDERLWLSLKVERIAQAGIAALRDIPER
jgi:hypothetical protein